MEKNELFDRFIKAFADATAGYQTEERRNIITTELWSWYKCSPGFNEKMCNELTNGIVELVEKELAPVEFEGVIISNNSTGISIRYTIPNSEKYGFIYMPKNEKFNIGDKCLITIKKI
jgi:hypothetical protein